VDLVVGKNPEVGYSFSLTFGWHFQTNINYFSYRAEVQNNGHQATQHQLRVILW